MRTLGRRIIHIDPPRGFAAETVAASVLYTTAYVFEAPISTTQTITGSIMGAGATQRPQGGPVERRRQHPGGLGPHHPDGRPGRRAGLLPRALRHRVTTRARSGGATKRLSAVRSGVAGNIVSVWIFAILSAGLSAAVVHAVAPSP